MGGRTHQPIAAGVMALAVIQRRYSLSARVFSFMGSHEGVGGLQRDGISNVCDLAHIWSHPLRTGGWEGVGELY